MDNESIKDVLWRDGYHAAARLIERLEKEIGGEAGGMEHLLITYHMSRSGEIAETCICLPMTKRRAADVMAGKPCPIIPAILCLLAVLQGYDEATFCCAEKVEL